MNIQDIDINNKTVILRCDYNVPINNGKIIDDSKIVASLETIKYLIEKNCKIIILSHFGRVKTEEDLKSNSLEPIAIHLEKLLNQKVIFFKDCMDTELKNKIAKLPYKSVILLENTRFSDIPAKKESACDNALAEFWASLADIFVLDAFGSCHRKHSSTYAIADYIPSCFGFLVQKELKLLDNVIQDNERPFIILMGGAKVDDKLQLLKNLLKRCDKVIISGGMTNSFFKAQNINIGKSLATDDVNILNELREILNLYKDKIELPIDVTVLNNDKIIQKTLEKIEKEDCIYDIGLQSIEKFKKILTNSKKVFMNGTMGKHEDERFQAGTYEILNFLATHQQIKTYIGGGDTTSAVKKFNLEDKLSNISTGGGATLDYISNGSLVAIDHIRSLNNGKNNN